MGQRKVCGMGSVMGSCWIAVLGRKVQESLTEKTAAEQGLEELGQGPAAREEGYSKQRERCKCPEARE